MSAETIVVLDLELPPSVIEALGIDEMVSLIPLLLLFDSIDSMQSHG